MPVCQYRNFDVTIAGNQPPYAVVANYRGASAQGSFHHDVHHDLWRDYTSILNDLRRAPGEKTLTGLGAHLFEHLLSADLRDLWLQARNDLDDLDAPSLRLRLNVHPPAVAALPWESLYDPRRRQPFGADPSIALVRVANHVGYTGRPRALTAQLPLRILIVAVDDPEGMDAAAEVAAVETVLAPLRPHQIELHTAAGRFDIHALRRRLHDVQPDVLHLITHGDPDGLLFWTTDGEPTLVTGAQIQATLRQIDSLKLVFLNACLAGQPNQETSYAAVAERLLQTGLPAVIAMQYEIADQAAVHFAGFLYEALVGGTCPGAVDHAVGIARSNLYIDAPHRLGYITPVLWLNTEDGLIFRLASQGALPPEITAPKPPTVEDDPAPLPPPPRIDVDLAEKEAWLASLPRYDRDRLSADARIVFDSRRNVLADAQRLLDELRRLDAQQSDGTVLAAPIRRALDRFAQLRREVDRLTQILVSNVGPGEA